MGCLLFFYGPRFLWAAIFGFLASRPFGLDGRRIWMVIGLVGLSHFLLDGVVHVAGLPLIGEGSPKLGLGLWKNMPVELGIETVMALAGIAVYWRLAGNFSVSRYGMTIFVALVTARNWTQLLLTTPPKSATTQCFMDCRASGFQWYRIRPGPEAGAWCSCGEPGL